MDVSEEGSQNWRSSLCWGVLVLSGRRNFFVHAIAKVNVSKAGMRDKKYARLEFGQSDVHPNLPSLSASKLSNATCFTLLSNRYCAWLSWSYL